MYIHVNSYINFYSSIFFDSPFIQVHKSLKFIESQVGSSRNNLQSEFDSEKSNFIDISNMMKDKVEHLMPSSKQNNSGGHHRK